MKNSYRIITKFSYKNKQYFIILSNENKIAYVVYENKKVITDIDKQDLNILNFVYNSLKIDKDSSIELGTKELYGKKFEFFYDINKKLLVFMFVRFFWLGIIIYFLVVFNWCRIMHDPVLYLGSVCIFLTS